MESFPQGFNARLTVPGAADEATELCNPANRLAQRWRVGARLGCFMNEAIQGLPFVLPKNGRAWRIGHQPGEDGRVLNAPGNYRIDCEQALDPLERLELPLLDAATALEYLVPCLDTPARGVPVETLERLLGRIDRYAGEQQPFERRCFLWRIALTGEDAPQGDRRQMLAFTMSRRRNGEGTGAHLKLCDTARTLGIGRDEEFLFRQKRRCLKARPQMAFGLLQVAVPGRAHQHIESMRSCCGKELVHIRFPICNAHQARAGQLRLELGQRLKAVEPLLALLLTDRALATAVAQTLLGLARPGANGQHPQGQSGRGEGERPMAQQPPAALGVYRPQICRSHVSGVIDLGGVLNGQDHRLASHAGDTRGHVRLQNLDRQYVRVIKEPVRRLDCSRILERLGNRGLRLARQLARELHQPRCTARIAQLGAAKLLHRPVRLVFVGDHFCQGFEMSKELRLRLTSRLGVYNQSLRTSQKDVGNDKPLTGEGWGEGETSQSATAESPAASRSRASRK